MGPVGTAGAAGVAVLILTEIVCCALDPHELVAVTIIFPPIADADVLTVIELVLIPLDILQPAGKIHV